MFVSTYLRFGLFCSFLFKIMFSWVHYLKQSIHVCVSRARHFAVYSVLNDAQECVTDWHLVISYVYSKHPIFGLT